MTDAPAVFDATFSDWRLVKGRKVVQIVLEVPLETAGLAYQVLGGMPDPGKSVWCAVARLKGGEQTNAATSPHSHSETVNKPGNAGGAKRWSEMSCAQQAGILCNEASFRAFLRDHGLNNFIASDKGYHEYPCGNANEAAEVIRQRCGVGSRSEIDSNVDALDEWRDLVADYRVWERALV